MYRVIKNLSVIFLIGFIALGINIKNSPVDNSINEVSTSNNMNKIFLSVLDNKDSYYNPKNITISHQATNNTTLNFNNDYIFKGDIFKDDIFIKSMNLNKVGENSKVNITSESPFINDLDISQNKLQLPNGIYKIVISTTAIDDQEYITPINLSVEYNKVVSYIRATNETPTDKIGLTLYFPSKDYTVDELIGITRFVDNTNRPISETIEQLQNYPTNNSGLSNVSPVGEINYLDIEPKYNLAYVDLPSSDDIYTSDMIKSKASMTSFMKSITKSSNYDIVKSITRIGAIERVKFLVDYNKADTFFIDEDVSKSIKYSWNNKAYLAYKSSNRYYLVDYDIKNAEGLTIKEKANIIYDVLKNGADNLDSTIPHDVNILDFSFDSNILNINFNSSFKNSFQNDLNLQSLMLDSILFSFTSINGIDYINILVDGENIETFTGIDIGKPLKAPTYINPEI